MASNYPTVYYGSYGETVKQLQQALNQVGYSLDVDGGFGEKTRAAVLDYQRRNGLRVDGVAGSETMGSLLARLTPATSGPSTSGQVLSGVSDETMSRMRQLEKGYAIRAANKGLAYKRWATNFNTNAASKSLWYMQTYCGGSYERLSQAADTAVARCHELSAQLDTMQTRLTEIAMLKQHIINYSRTRQVFQEYKASGYSKKFLKEHQQEIEDHRATKRVFNELGLKKLPTVKSLNEEYSQVLAAKKSVYAQLRTAEAERRELLIHRENLRPILAPEEKPRGKRKEQDER